MSVSLEPEAGKKMSTGWTNWAVLLLGRSTGIGSNCEPRPETKADSSPPAKMTLAL
jgi:hypothetical protein